MSDSIVEQKRKFDEIVNIIYKFAHKYSREYKVDFDDLVEVGYEYYAWCLKNFDKRKNTKFSTYFYIQIKQRMLDEIYKIRHNSIDILYNDIKSQKVDDFNFEDTIKSPEDLNPQYVAEVIEDSKQFLSYEGQIILKWLLSFKWLKKGHVMPTELYCQIETGLSQVSVRSGYEEIKYYWRERGWKINTLAA